MNETSPLFSIVTPSLNMLSYLKRCHKSIIDQKVDVEHIVIDAMSSDGTVDWLNKQKDIVSVVESDKGMYDALNKGFKIAKGEIFGYLNCDEQYLENSLEIIQNIFSENQCLDAVFGNVLITDVGGNLLAFRKGFAPRWFYIQRDYLYLSTCAMFFRRKIFDEGLSFDKRYKSVGDADFVVRLLKKKHEILYINKYLSSFAITGRNLGLNKASMHELRSFRKQSPSWLFHLGFLVKIALRIEKLLSCAYWEIKPIKYAIYGNNLDVRKTFIVKKASPFFPKVKNKFENH